VSFALFGWVLRLIVINRDRRWSMTEPIAGGELLAATPTSNSTGDRIVGLTYREHVLAQAETEEEARVMARHLPRPSAIRRHDDGQWVVVQLLPARWEPTRSDVVAGVVTAGSGGSRRRSYA
jgi:hypothetical protein